MASGYDDLADERASPLLRADLLQPRDAAVNGTGFGDYASLHQGDKNVHVRQLNHVVNNYAYPPPQARCDTRSDSHYDHPSIPCWTVPFGRNRDFVGRESILNRLLNMILPNADEYDCQHTVISGLGGVGKTQVALEAAFRVRRKFPDCHVFWVPAIDATTFENAYREIGRELKIHGIEDNTANIKLLVKAALSQSAKSWLLIIDNADDVALFKTTTEITSLSDYLPFNLKGSILFTSRNDEVSQKLDIRKENILHLTELTRSEAINMLQKGLQAHQMSDKQSLESLIEFLTYFPLAIKQASAYMIKTGMVVSKYLEHCRLSDEHLVELLSKDFNDRARYKATKNPVATTWLISFRAISRDNPLAAKYLLFMAFLAEKDIPKYLLPLGDNELEAYEAIGMLKAFAFISERAGEGTYDMHRLVRLVMQNWLRKEGELQTCITAVIQRLDTVFPQLNRNSPYFNRGAWERYLPHAMVALVFQDHSLDQISRSSLLDKVSISLYFLGKYKDAEQMGQQALDLQIKLLGAEHPRTLKRMSNLSMMLKIQGRNKEAEQIIRQTLELRIKVLGTEHPSTLLSMGTLSTTLSTLGQYKEAEQMIRQTLELQMKVIGAEHPNTLTSRGHLSQMLSVQGQYKEAEQMDRQTLELQMKVIGPEHPDTIISMSWLAYNLYHLGRYEEAEQMNRQVLEMQTKILGDEHPDTIASGNNLANDLRILGGYEEAEQMGRQVHTV